MADSEGIAVERLDRGIVSIPEFYRLANSRYVSGTDDNHLLLPSYSAGAASLQIDPGSIQSTDCIHSFPDYSKTLLETLNWQRSYKYYTDITVRVQQCDFPAHRCILLTLGKKMQYLVFNNVDHEGILVLDKLSVVGFRNILEFVYTGILRFHASTVSETLSAAQFLEVQDVERICLSILKAQIQESLSTAPAESGLADQQQNVVGQQNSVDTSYLEDYLKILEHFHHPPHESRFNNHDNALSTDPDITTDAACVPITPPHSSVHIQPISPVLPDENLPRDMSSDNYNKEPANLLMSIMHTNEQNQDKSPMTETLSLPCVDEEESPPDNSKLEDTFQHLTNPLQNAPSSLSSLSETDKTPTKFSDYDEDSGGRRKKTRPIKMKGGLSCSTALPPPKKRKLAMISDVENDSTSQRKEETKSDLTSSKNVRHTCHECGRNFSKDIILKKHMKLHEETSVTYACHVCTAKFSRSAELTRHLRTEHSSDNWICKLCDPPENFGKDAGAYRIHMDKEHSVKKPFACQHPGCSFKANKPSTLDKHTVIHTSEKSFTCSNCHAAFSQPNGLRSHMKSCLDKRSYLCDYCGNAFNHSQSLKVHRLLHTGVKPHTCQVCGAKFADIRNLRRHRRIHENTYPYSCQICKKNFRHSNSLKTHMNTHSNLTNNNISSENLISS